MGLLLAAPPFASAREFRMSGTWLVRKGQAFVPFQIGVTAGGTQMTHASMGSWTEAPFFPSLTPMGGMSPLVQVVRDAGLVSAMGSAPATLVIPAHHWRQTQDAALPFSGVNLIQITSMLQIDAPYATATLRAGGGPGSFTWCPSDPACTAVAPVPGVGSMNGRVVYRAGPNQFGGTMQLGLRGGGVVSVPLHPMALWVGHSVFSGHGPALRKLALGGGANDAPTIQTVFLPRGHVTAPTMAPPMGSLIHFPGPAVTTMFGNTLTMPTGAKLLHPAITPQMAQTARYTTNEAFPHTTGTVLVQAAPGSGGDDLFSVMGSDARTPLGAGNLNLVAGGLARTNRFGPAAIVRSRHGQFDKVFLSLGPPVPSLSLAGAATAVVLMLLATGYAWRRRTDR